MLPTTVSKTELLPNRQNPPTKKPPDSESASSEKEAPYPKAVFLIVAYEFCERFSYYGVLAVLVLFLTDQFHLSDDQATSVYHIFVFMCYLTPLPGALLSDSWLGKFNTILYLSLAYCAGLILLAVSSVPVLYPDGADLTLQMVGPFLGLLLMAVGTGCIKPCVPPFGGDQFGPGQEKSQATFFSLFFMSVSMGSLSSKIITPLIRENVKCFGEECFPAAFGLPAALLSTAVLLFLSGRMFFKNYPSEENILGKISKCFAYAVTHNGPKPKGKTNFLYRSTEKFGERFIEEIMGVGRVAVMMLPLPIFWALSEQSGSRWILMATKMNGVILEDRFHQITFVIRPDQIQAVAPLLTILLVPLFESVVYPLLNKLRIPHRPLQRVSAGLFIEALTFVYAGVLEYTLEETLLHPPVESTSMAVTNLGEKCTTLQLYDKDSTTRFNRTTLVVGQTTNYQEFEFGEYSMTYSRVCGDGMAERTNLSLNKVSGLGSMHHVVVYQETDHVAGYQDRTRAYQDSARQVGYHESALQVGYRDGAHQVGYQDGAHQVGYQDSAHQVGYQDSAHQLQVGALDVGYQGDDRHLGGHLQLETFAENPAKPRRGRIFVRTILLFEAQDDVPLCSPGETRECLLGVMVDYTRIVGDTPSTGVIFWTNRTDPGAAGRDWGVSKRTLLVQDVNDTRREAKRPTDGTEQLTEVIHHCRYVASVRPLHRNASGQVQVARVFEAPGLVRLKSGYNYDVFVFPNASAHYVGFGNTTEGPVHYRTTTHIVNPTSTVSILWQVPMYLLNCLGEILVSVTCLQFAYSQAPLSMKSVVTAIFYFTTAAGNLLVAVVAEMNFFEQWVEFLSFAGLQLLAFVTFCVLAVSYKYKEYKREPDGEDGEDGVGEKTQREIVSSVTQAMEELSEPVKLFARYSPYGIMSHYVPTDEVYQMSQRRSRSKTQSVSVKDTHSSAPHQRVICTDSIDPENARCYVVQTPRDRTTTL